MKKILLIILCFMSVQCAVVAKTIKLVGTAENDFSTQNPSSEFSLKTEKAINTPSGILEQGSVITGYVIKVIPPKRGKRDAYLYFKLKSISIPNEDRIITIDNEKAIGKITMYKSKDLKDLNYAQVSYTAGKTVANLFVKHISYPIDFVKGVFSADEGENKIQSGMQQTYEGSFFSYFSEGNEFNLKKDDKLTLTLQLTDSE